MMLIPRTADASSLRRWYRSAGLLLSVCVVVLVGGCGRDQPSKATRAEVSESRVPATGSGVDTSGWDAARWEAAGDTAAATGRTARAIELYRGALETAAAPTARVLDKMGQQWMNQGRPFESLQTLGRAIELSPNDAALRKKMVGLQAALGLQWESAEHLQWLVQHGHGDVGLLIMLSDLSRPHTVAATCEYALRHAPDDPRPHYSLARVSACYDKWQEVADQLSDVVERLPEFVPARFHYRR